LSGFGHGITLIRPLSSYRARNLVYRGISPIHENVHQLRNGREDVHELEFTVKQFGLSGMSLCCLQIALLFAPASATQNVDSSKDDSIPPNTSSSMTLPEGTVISVRIADKVNSNRNRPGDLFTGSVDPSILVENRVVIPRGTEARIQMVDSKKGGHIHGKAYVELQLVSLVLHGEGNEITTEPVDKKKGALSTKAQAEVKPGAAGAAEVAASVNPVGAVALGGIAAFRAAKVDIKPGSRIPFTLSEPFTFRPPSPQPSPDDNQSKKKGHRR